MNQLIDHEDATPTVLRTFDWDDNGGLLDDDVREYEWDAAHRLVAIDHGGSLRTELSYDGQGRIHKIVEKTSGTPTSTIYLLWCGMELCEERTGTNGGTVSKRFFPYGSQEGSDEYYYSRDHLGSIREVTDDSGSLVARYDYDPWGRMSQLYGTVKPPFGYAGYYLHGPTGLNLAVFRAYDPDLGQWLSRDPIGEAGGIRLHGYVGNDPVNGVDPSGLIVQGVYDVSTGTLTLMDVDSGQWVQGSFKSGGESGYLPIPTGTYDILAHQGREGFYRLEPRDSKYGDDKQEDTGRYEFRLHRPGRSFGCITANDDEGWAAIHSLIEGTAVGTPRDVDSKSRNPFNDKQHETLPYYGEIVVVETGL